MKIGLIRERKNPPDRRVAFLPDQCALVQELYPNIQFLVEPSPDRCISDDEYQKLGIEVTESCRAECPILFGIKEVPPADLIDGKTYFMFSHTIKKQAHNRILLQKVLEKKITLVDYECILDEKGNRTVAFGRFAGIVGAYNAIRMWFLRYKNIILKPAHACANMAEMLDCAKKEMSQMGNIKIAITGSGRVGHGAIEVLRALSFKEVEPEIFVENEFENPVFTVLSSRHYIRHSSDNSWDEAHFRKNPETYQSEFMRFAKTTDVLIACAYWNPNAPLLFSRSDTANSDFRIRVISDVTCDLDGSIPTTLRTSSISEPFFDVDPQTFQEMPAFSNEKNITICSIDNLPTELPYDASRSFGEMLIKNVLPEIVVGGGRAMDGAKIASGGNLEPPFRYLENYAFEKAD